MRILIIGAVAAGTSAAAKARRNTEDAEIVVYERDKYISYSGCGMPYVLSHHIQSVEELVPRDPAFFKSKYNVDILTEHEVLAIDPTEKTIQVKMLASDKIFTDHYDKLILATGAKAVIPPISGIDETHVFSLRNITDLNKIASFVQLRKPEKTVIIGTGFIGLEVCENLMSLGIRVTLVEKLPQVTPGLDRDMSQYVKEHLISKGVEVLTGDAVSNIVHEMVQLASGETVAADMVIVATGVKPNVELAKDIGVEIGETGAIRVNPQMQTNLPDIYACGDCIEQYNLITGKSVYRPLGSTANKTGRIAGDCVTGGDLAFRGILGTGIFKIFDLTVAQTGLSEREALSQGYEIVVSHNIKPNKPTYMGGKEMVIKAIADKKDGRLLGVQIVGEEGVDKRVDVFATAMTFGAKAEDLAHFDLAYAPPFSTTKDPVLYTGMILDNAIRKDRTLITAEELNTCMHSGEKYTLIDARVPKQFEKSHIPTAVNIPQERLREVCDELDKNVLTITYCNKGVTGNAAQNILLNKGFKKVVNVSGGHKNYFKTTKK
jgi:NADPH-dependent 2,4-dienoyl-CoA reductase/sulfur reductase-like enzyme/rhodanese-related sulfurtransferase